MPAYVIVLREGPVKDPDAYAEYQRISAQNRGDFKLKPLVVYGATETLEGDPPDGVVVLEFPSVEDARAWYNSPGYQAAVPHRLRSGNFRAVIVEGF